MNKQVTAELLLFRKGKVGQFAVVTQHQINSVKFPSPTGKTEAEKHLSKF